MAQPNRAVQLEFDHRLRLADRGNLCREIGVRQLLLGDVSGVVHNFERLALRVADRIVRRLNPELATVLGDAAVLARLIFAASESRPEFLVLLALSIGIVDEDTVVMADNLVSRKSHGLQKVVVGREDRAVEIEFDHRLRLVDRGVFAPQVGQFQFGVLLS